MGAIILNDLSGSTFSINPSNIVYVEKKDNIIYITYNVNEINGWCGKLSSKLFTSKYTYPSYNEAQRAFIYISSKI